MSDRQQINLYQPAADEGRRPFSARTAGITIATVVATVLAIWAYGSWQVQQVQRSVAALEQQQQRQAAAVTAAGSMHAARANPEQLQARIKELIAEIDIRRRALARLQQGAEGASAGFSARLAGLARSHVEGLWIDHLVLSGSRATLTLEGVALDAQLVPRFLRDLGKDSSLSGAHFEQFVIERPPAPASPGTVRFRAESRFESAAQVPAS